MSICSIVIMFTISTTCWKFLMWWWGVFLSNGCMVKAFLEQVVCLRGSLWLWYKCSRFDYSVMLVLFEFSVICSFHVCWIHVQLPFNSFCWIVIVALEYLNQDYSEWQLSSLRADCFIFFESLHCLFFSLEIISIKIL